VRSILAIAATAACLSATVGTIGTIDQPTFKSGVELVHVSALVTRDEVPITGLTASDFEVLDNGVRQTIESVLSTEDPIDVVLALDTSGSLDPCELAQLSEAVRAALGDLGPADRAGLIAFSQEVTELVPLSHEHARARGSLDRLHSAGATTLVDAAYAALLSARTPGRRSLALLFTDGLDTWSWLEPRWVLDVARRSDTVVYAVELRDAAATAVRVPGGRSRVDAAIYYRLATRFLSDLTEATGGRRLDAGNLGRLQATLRAALVEFRQRYVLVYAPRGVPGDGWHSLEVRVKRRGVEVRARPGYSR
jgi:VWFA-related protein